MRLLQNTPPVKFFEHGEIDADGRTYCRALDIFCRASCAYRKSCAGMLAGPPAKQWELIVSTDAGFRNLVLPGSLPLCKVFRAMKMAFPRAKLADLDRTEVDL